MQGFFYRPRLFSSNKAADSPIPRPKKGAFVQKILSNANRSSVADGRRGTMNLSKRSIEMLLDLVEIKLSYMDISDREDARDMQVLERCRSELQSLDREPESVGAFVRPIRRPGRPRTAA